MTLEDCVGLTYEQIAAKYDEMHPEEKEAINNPVMNLDLIVWKHTVLNPMVKARIEQEKQAGLVK